MRCSSRCMLLATVALAATGLLALPTVASATVGHSRRAGFYSEAVAHAGSARTLQSYPLIIHQQTGRCLNSDANGNVYTLPCRSGISSQYWRLFGDPSLRIIWSRQTGRCLDANANGNVHTQTGRCQYWHQSRTTPFTLSPVRQRGRCLEANANGNVYTLPCRGSRSQYWNVGALL